MVLAHLDVSKVGTLIVAHVHLRFNFTFPRRICDGDAEIAGAVGEKGGKWDENKLKNVSGRGKLGRVTGRIDRHRNNDRR